MPETSHGERRRIEILAAALDLSTALGLDGLSFSALAKEVRLTKAGVAAHFASKQELQLAVIDAAADAYRRPLDAAALAHEPGLARLHALMLAWFDHLDAIAYRGGCFFAAAGNDFAGRPGPVRSAVARQTSWLIRSLDEQAKLAARLGELAADASPEVLAFQLHALAQEANLRRELLDEQDAFATARRALDQVLARSAAPSLSRSPAKRSRASRKRKETK